MAKPPERSEAVIDGDDHDLLRRRKMSSVIEGGSADRVAAAVDPNHHRPARSALRHGIAPYHWGVHVEVEAVLAPRDRPLLPGHAAEGAGVLRARRAVGERHARLLPGRRRLRRTPAPIS